MAQGSHQCPQGPTLHLHPRELGRVLGPTFCTPKGLGSDLVTYSDSQGLWSKEKPEPGNWREEGTEAAWHWGDAWPLGQKDPGSPDDLEN